jgi:hypothetical protein
MNGVRVGLALALVLAGSAAVRSAPPPAPAIVMEDQCEQVHELAHHRGDVVVLIYGDRRSAAASRALGEWLHVTFHPAARGLPPAQARRMPVRPLPGLPAGARSPDVLAIPVACVGPVPGLVRKVIRAQVRSGSPDVPVWLDFADQMKRRFGLQPGVPNLVVFDAAGRARYQAAGTLSAEQRNELLRLIERARQDIVTPQH